MKRIWGVAAILLAVSATAPAMAQGYDRGYRWNGYDRGHGRGYDWNGYDRGHGRGYGWNGHGRGGGISERLHRDRHFIERGIRDGSLNRWEARRLSRQQAEIESFKRDAWSDGRLSRRERRVLGALERDHRRDIWRERRD